MIANQEKNDERGDLHEKIAGDGEKKRREKHIGNMGCRLRQLVVEVGECERGGPTG